MEYGTMTDCARPVDGHTPLLDAAECARNSVAKALNKAIETTTGDDVGNIIAPILAWALFVVIAWYIVRTVFQAGTWFIRELRKRD